jgi:mRNA interferase RelE/StbE
LYDLAFRPSAKRAWHKLDPSVRHKLEKTLERRLQNPFIESAALSGDLAGCYKIKSKSSGYRLIYKVTESELILLVITVGKREGGESYDDAKVELENMKDEN